MVKVFGTMEQFVRGEILSSHLKYNRQLSQFPLALRDNCWLITRVENKIQEIRLYHSINVFSSLSLPLSLLSQSPSHTIRDEPSPRTKEGQRTMAVSIYNTVILAGSSSDTKAQEKLYRIVLLRFHNANITEM